MIKKEEALENIEKNHNWSLYDEIYDRNKNGLNRIALFYRGTKITYGQMFKKMKEYASSLSAKGIKAGMEIPVCMNNTPEFVYLLGAASILGVKLNIFGEEFDEEYITEIINECNSDVIFVSDDKYEHIKNSINKSNVNNIVMTSLCDSLKNGEDAYEKFDKPFYDFKNKVQEYKKENNNIESITEFSSKKAPYVKHEANLEEEFTTTYSSGSTNSQRPKGIVHKNRSYVTMGIFHDPNISGTPSMKNLRVLAQIPTHSNTEVQSCITDGLIQGSTICLEPIYNKEFFMYSLLINKTEFSCGTRSFYVHLAKQILELKKQGIHVKLPYLAAPMSVGEPLSKGEEKLINKMLRVTNAGTKFTHTPKSVVCVSVAGGDCEHGGIFFIMFRNLMNKVKRMPKDEYDILRTYSMVDIKVLDKDGNVLEDGKLGRMYASSKTNMKEYRNNEKATQKAFKTINGKEYLDCSVYGYKDKKGYIHVKGRMNEFTDELPGFSIADEILKDTKNVLSCEVIPLHDENDNLVYAAHIEMQPGVNPTPRLLKAAITRCKIKYGEEISDKVVFRIRSNKESFPTTGCGKRSNKELEKEALENCIRPIVTTNNKNGYFISHDEYFDKKAKKLTLQHIA